MFKQLIPMAALGLTLAWAPRSQAELVDVTVDPLTFGSYDQTGQSDYGGYGGHGFVAGRAWNMEYRNFFAFDLRNLPAGTITSAKLRLIKGSTATPGVVFQLGSVSTPLDVLGALHVPPTEDHPEYSLRPDIFADLASGELFGTSQVLAESDFVYTELNSRFLSAANALSGQGSISLGGQILGSAQGEYAFQAGWPWPGYVELYLTVFIPEPKLSIASLGGQIVVSWPMPADGYLLERASVLTAGNGLWVPAALPYQTNGSIISVSLPDPPAGDNCFFRLQK